MYATLDIMIKKAPFMSMSFTVKYRQHFENGMYTVLSTVDSIIKKYQFVLSDLVSSVSVPSIDNTIIVFKCIIFWTVKTVLLDTLCNSAFHKKQKQNRIMEKICDRY